MILSLRFWFDVESRTTIDQTHGNVKLGHVQLAAVVCVRECPKMKVRSMSETDDNISTKFWRGHSYRVHSAQTPQAQSAH